MKLLYRVLITLGTLSLLLAGCGPMVMKWLHYYRGYDLFGVFMGLMYIRSWIFLASACLLMIGFAVRRRSSISA